MMVNCPKCGFSQPRDLYCARCGVDMTAYRPIEKPLIVQLARSTMFQIAVLGFVVLTVFSFARQAHRRELAERKAEIENAQNSQVIVNRNQELKKNEFSSNNGSANLAPTGAMKNSAQVVGAAANSNAGGSPPSSTTSGPPTSGSVYGAPVPLVPASAPASDETKSLASASGVRAVNLSITFAEVPRGSGAELLTLADRRTSQLQESFNIGVVNSLSAKIKSFSNMNSLDSTSRGLKANEAMEFYGGQREESTGQFLGFVVEALSTLIDENETRLQIRIFRYLRDSNGQVEEFAVPMPDQISVPRGAGLFISGAYLLPRKVSESDRRFYSPLKVLHVLSKDEFLKGNSDFVIFVEPK